MIREIHENELKGLLELYLHLHESTVPEMTEQLNRTWSTIVQDRNHHIVIKVVGPDARDFHNCGLQSEIRCASCFRGIFR